MNAPARSLAAALCVFALFLIVPVHARGQGLIRDAETERFLDDLLTPLLKAAGLPESAVSVSLVGNNSINAFVTGDSRIYIHTGTLVALRTPAEIRAVLAHELGHIIGGHVRRHEARIRDARLPMALIGLLGVAVAAAGEGHAGMGLILGGQNSVYRTLLAHTRGEEANADQAAIAYMERAGFNPSGLLKTLEQLERNERYAAGRVDEYVLTHPLSAERVALVRRRVAQSRFRDRSDAEALHMRLVRIRAKLQGFLSHPDVAFNESARSDTPKTEEARWLREAVAWHRLADSRKSHALLDRILARNPRDPWIWELKGQFHLEHGQADKAVSAYRKAYEFAPREPQILAALGAALMARGGRESGREAARYIERAGTMAPDDPFIIANLARAYAMADDNAMAAYSEARKLALMGNWHDARRHATAALGQLPEGAEKRRAHDILQHSEEEIKKAAPEFPE